MAIRGIHRLPYRLLGLCAAMVTAAAILQAPVMAQQTKQAAKPDSVFDEEKKAAAPTTKAAAPSDRDTIGFSQQNVAAQMNELEERMFRLSEALRGLEPENASRLRLALQFSREELILEQMRETHKLLKEAQLSKAETEVKELIAKLQHLRNLLLAEDLDFQLKLARLRQMRETLGQLERIITEEKRELGWSRFAMEQRKRLERFNTRKPDLQSLVRDQQAVLADTKKSSENGAKPAKEVRSAIRGRELKIRSATAGLASDPMFADLQPPHLRRADGNLADAVSHLEGTDAPAAVAAEEKALGLLREELNRLDETMAQTEKTITDPEFRRRAEEQAKNRGATELLDESSARLGDVGVALRKDLIRAAASMKSAEAGLGKSAAPKAADDQSNALEALTKSREGLADSIEKLLVELRTELQSRLVGELTEMHEIQMAIRESTQAQAPRVLQKARTALLAVAGLSKQEGALAARSEHLLALIEETEYGIALPTTLHILVREMKTVEIWLGASDASPKTIALETRIEEDLLGLIQAIRRLPARTPPQPGEPLSGEPRERERELNRLIAELKMIRMIQSRLNDDTVVVDKTRPPSPPLSPELRREVESLETTQDEIRDSLDKIGERLPFPEGLQ
jgi:hypothetical protein